MGLKHEYDTKKNMKKKAFKVSEKYLFWHEGFPKYFVEITSTFLEFIKSA